MKKLFLLAVLLCGTVSAFAQEETPAAPAPPPETVAAEPKSDSIAGMIAALEAFYEHMAELFGGAAPSKNSDQTYLGAVNYPNSVKVTYLGQTQKLSKTHQKAVTQWLKNYEKKPADTKFYLRETLVSEDGANFWIMTREEVLTSLLAKAKKDDVVTLHLQILGFNRKAGAAAYFLLCDAQE